MPFWRKLAIGIVLIVFFNSLLQFGIFNKALENTTASLSLRTNQRVAQNYAEQLTIYFKELEASLKVVGSTDAFVEDPEMLKKALSLFQEIDAIVVMDKQGNVIGSSGTALDLSGRNLSDKEYFKRSILGQTYISDIYTTDANNQVIVVSIPIIQDGVIERIVAGVVHPQSRVLASMFKHKYFGYQGFIAVLDSHGHIIYHVHQQRVGLESPIANRLTESAGAFIAPLPLPDSVLAQHFIGYYKVPDLNWTICVGTPTSEASKFNTEVFYNLISTSAITLFVLIIASVYIIRRYTKPVGELMNSFGQLQQGHYIPIQHDKYEPEFHDMIQKYNDTICKMQETHYNLQTEADIDGLTGAYNRRAFEKLIASLTEDIAAKRLAPVGIMIIDVDNFKHLNDSQGHLIGDVILKKLANILTIVAGTRSVFRFGGDEFAVVLRDTGRETLLEQAEQIRRHCQQNLNGYTISIGTACYPDNATTMEILLKLADQALYISKIRKNQVTHCTDKECCWPNQLE